MTLSAKRPGAVALFTAVPSALALAALACAPGCTITTTNDPNAFDSGLVDLDDAGASNNPCYSCQYTTCETQWTTCVNDPICKKIYDCSTAVGCDQNCVNNCFTVANNQTSQSEYLAITQCQAGAVCGACAATCGTPSTSCTTADGGAPDVYVAPVDSGVADTGLPDTSVADAGSACDQCNADYCSSQVAQCQAGSPCKQLDDCQVACATGTGDFNSCLATCGTTYPAGAAPLAARGACTNQNCQTACSQ